MGLSCCPNPDRASTQRRSTVYGSTIGVRKKEVCVDEMRQKLMNNALEQYSRIFPCADKPFSECFTVDHNRLLFWFNTEDETTHVLTTELN